MEFSATLAAAGREGCGFSSRQVWL